MRNPFWNGLLRFVLFALLLVLVQLAGLKVMRGHDTDWVGIQVAYSAETGYAGQGNGWVNVMAFGAKGDGITDDSAAIQAAIDNAVRGAGVGGKPVYIPPGVYLITETIHITTDRTNIFGAGVHSTQILFNPRTEKVLWNYSKNDRSILIECSIRQLGHISSNKVKKTALRITDADIFLCEDFAVHASFSGNKSIGIHMRGRDMNSFNKITIYTDRPIVIDDNPNHDIDIDHYHISDTYLGAVDISEPVVYINDGVNLSNVIFDGYNAWVGGNGALFWVDTKTTRISQSLILKNIRYEQVKDHTAWGIYISHNYGLSNIEIDNYWQPNTMNGIYLRKANQTKISNTYILSDKDYTSFHVTKGNNLTLENVVFYNNSTFLIDMDEKAYLPAYSGGVLFAYYDRNQDDDGSYPLRINGVNHWGKVVTLENSAMRKLPLGFTGSAGSQTIVVSTSGAQGTWLSFSGTVLLVSGTSNTSNEDSLGKMCVYFDKMYGGAVLKNNLGTEKKFVIMMSYD